MGQKQSSAMTTTIRWLVCIAGICVVGWLLWRTVRPHPTPAPPKVALTNVLDVARGTNLLHWLSTNFTAQPNAPATNPVVPLPTNRVQLNPPGPRKVPFPTPVTNIITAVSNRAPLTAATNLFSAKPPVETPERPVKNVLEAQIALARRAISSGPIDGAIGYQTRAALRAFQLDNELTPTGDLDAATREELTLAAPVMTNYVVTLADLARLHPIPNTWVGKSQVESMDYETALELIAEKHQSSHALIKSLNPGVNWTNVTPFTIVKVPYVPRPPVKQRAAFIRISLSAKTLEAFDVATNLLAHFPCSIAARVEKRPVGQLTVVTGAENPNYTFDPAVFPESEEARTIDHKLIIPPGPNNPVGAAWISLDRPGYGIHGTPRPDQVGRTESHGCFRLANWNAEYLLRLVSPGVTVYVEP